LEDVKRFQALLTFFVAGFATLTLLVNGLTTRFVVGWLGLTRKSQANRFAYNAAARHLEELMRDEIEDRLKHDPLYSHADWKRVWKALPVHEWEEEECGQHHEVSEAEHWHQQLDEDDVDEDFEELRDEIESVSKQLKSLHAKLDDAKETRRNNIVRRLHSLPDFKHSDYFDELLVLYSNWAADKGDFCSSALEVDTGDPAAKSALFTPANEKFTNARRRSSLSTMVRSYTYRQGQQRPFTMEQAFPHRRDASPTYAVQARIDYWKRHWGMLQV